MKNAAPLPIHLKDYTPPNWLIDEVHLTFRLHQKHTIVQSRIQFRPNPATTDRTFELHGEELSLRWARIDGQDWKPQIKDGILRCSVPDAPFTWEAEVEINPSANTVLEGLYISNGIYCTQCEAEGFRAKGVVRRCLDDVRAMFGRCFRRITASACRTPTAQMSAQMH